MGYAVYWESTHNRFAGYGVPSQCEHPDCKVKINRGLGCLCGDEPGGGDTGCGLYFCCKHRNIASRGMRCERCEKRRKPFAAKPDTRLWMRHMLKDKSWRDWRDENPKAVETIRASIGP